MFERLARQLQSARRILLSTHECPDGDGIGSLLALLAILADDERAVRAATVGALPRSFRFLPGAEQVADWTRLDPAARRALLEQTDLVLIVDTHSPAMIGSLGDALRASGLPVTYLDHHPLQPGAPEGVYCEPEASSTGELAWCLARELTAELDAAMATCLYAAIAYDTNSFKYLRGRSATHQAAADLVAHGADTDAIYRHLFASNSRGKMRFVGEVLQRGAYAANGRIAWVRIPADLVEECGVSRDDLRDAITMLLEVEGVEVAASFLAVGDGSCRVSLRSMGRYPVNCVAAELGGGGHVLAAGAHLPLPIARVIPLVMERLTAMLGAPPEGPDCATAS